MGAFCGTLVECNDANDDALHEGHCHEGGIAYCTEKKRMKSLYRIKKDVNAL